MAFMVFFFFNVVDRVTGRKYELIKRADGRKVQKPSAMPGAPTQDKIASHLGMTTQVKKEVLHKRHKKR